MMPLSLNIIFLLQKVTNKDLPNQNDETGIFSGKFFWLLKICNYCVPKVKTLLCYQTYMKCKVCSAAQYVVPMCQTLFRNQLLIFKVLKLIYLIIGGVSWTDAIQCRCKMQFFGKLGQQAPKTKWLVNIGMP